MIVIVQQRNRSVVLPAAPDPIKKRRAFMSMTHPKTEKGCPLVDLRNRRVEGEGAMRGNSVSIFSKVIFDFDGKPRLAAAICADK